MESKYSEYLVYYTLYLDVKEFYFKADHLLKIDGHLFSDTNLCNKMHEDAAKSSLV